MFFIVFFSAIWSSLASSLQDPTLRQLATTSLRSLLLSATAPSTNKKYMACWARWETWASSKAGTVVFPVNPYQLTLYITQLATTGPKSIAESATAAIKWVHSLAGLPSPTNNPMVKTALQGFKRLHSSAPIRKEPITPDILSKVMDRHGQ